MSLELGFLERKTPDVKPHSRPVLWRVCGQAGAITADSERLLCLLGFSLVGSCPAPRHTYQVGRCAPPSGGDHVHINDLEFFSTGNLSILPINSFMESFIFTVRMKSWIFVFTLSYNPLLFYIMHCSNCSHFNYWDLSQGPLYLCVCTCV